MHALTILLRFARSRATFKISSFVVLVLGICLASRTYAQAKTELTVEQKVGQLFIWTIGGKALSPKTADWLKQYQPGAVIAFSRNIQNPAQVAKFNSDLQKLAAKNMKAPLFLMIDQEGGVVTRVRSSTPLPSALAVGKLDDPKLAMNFGKTKADFLKRLGFNVNLAPVLDLSDPQKDSFIGNRAFGDNPLQVSNVAIAYAEGLAQGGVMPTAKHFPGHGGISHDSHYSLAQKLATIEELEKRDLKPFADYSGKGFVKAIMTAHLALPNVDPSGLPATYSPVLIQEYLRGKLGYDGLVFTDDLEMNGAAGVDIGERAVTAFLAGNDMLMLAGAPANQRKAFQAVLLAVKDGRIPMERLNESVGRILLAKNQIHARDFKYNSRAARLASRQLTKLSTEIMKRNFEQAAEATAVAGWQEKASGKVLVMSSDKRFFTAFQKKYPGKARFFRLSPHTIDAAKLEMASREFRWTLYYASGTRTAKWLGGLDSELRAKTIVINANHAGEVAPPNNFLSLYNINSTSPQSGGWLAEALKAPSVRSPANSK